MICGKCGAHMEEDKYFCEKCGGAVQLVPDYNPMDEIYTGVVADETPEMITAARIDEPEEAVTEEFETGDLPTEASDKPVLKKKKKKGMGAAITGVLLLLILVIGATVWFSHSSKVNSYDYQMEQARLKMQESDYEAAIDHGERAAELNKRKTEPYFLLADAWLALGKTDSAIKQYEYIITMENSNEDAYQGLIDIYEEEEQPEEIKALLKEANQKIREVFAEYIAATPAFSIDTMTHNTAIEVELIAEEGQIYYTLDNSVPDAENGILYTAAIEIGEGETTVRAILVNEKGISSDEAVMTYEVIFDVPDAPAISHATGVYTEAIQVEVQQPGGYEVYYTMDGSDPTKDSIRYAGPVILPMDGNDTIIFSAVTIDENGLMSGISRRSYEFRIPVEVPVDDPEDDWDWEYQDYGYEDE